MSPHPSLSFNHLQQYNWAQSLRLTVGLSLNACANRRVDGVESCCSMLSPAWHLVCPQWMFSMSSFLHRLYALPSSRTTFAQQFQRVSFTFFFHALRNKKKTRLACWRREHFGGRKIEMEILKILRRFERLWSYLNLDLLGLKLG